MELRRVVRRIEAAEMTEGGGVTVRRTLGGPELDRHDPFLLLDEFRSDEPNDYLAGFPDHPHRGFETVTYMLAGAMRHEDHRGNRGRLVPGSVQWMTAGRGIVHSEMPEQQDGLMWGFQLWINLPAREKMREPRYQEFPPDRIPEAHGEGGVKVRVIAGEALGARGPVSGIATDPLYLDVLVPAGASFDQPVPRGHNAVAYAFDGEGDVGEGAQARVRRGTLAVLGDGDAVRATAPLAGPLRLLLIAARPLGEPVARYGPFVMNTRDEIRQAFEDFRRGTLAG